VSVVRTVERALIAAFFIGVLVQFYFAGVGAFGAESYDMHRMLGNVLILVSFIVLVLSLLLREWWEAAILLFVLMIVQSVLANAGNDASAWIGALHALNALVIFALSGYLFHAAVIDALLARRRPMVGREERRRAA
jgi:hypothetical protein